MSPALLRHQSTLQQAIQQVEVWRAEGKKIVFTNGCFDLLHPGHIDYLEKAAEHGDIFIIGLNDDDSIRRLKGETRPINPLSDRAVMLAALRAVDLVIPFSEDTPLNLISALLPDTLIKGGDYQPDDIVGAAEVRNNGGEVLVIPFVDGYSSSKLIQRIQNS
ncbi:MAG: D-glycero-beta-D-manno-heptose 1-phosphate adenylyltransferase [Mariprofundus sp.]|nr:D-glycero-beta-D-manno-heptose 1-phosphate adenylyltransferase [Mariprofundus sp.]